MTIPRSALWLFVLYLAVYVGFVAVSAFAPQAMAATPFAGMPLSILYGFVLIGLAFVLAGIYLRVTR
jgi:uncharacterized membrane protein (DUF485 family)